MFCLFPYKWLHFFRRLYKIRNNNHTHSCSVCRPNSRRRIFQRNRIFRIDTDALTSFQIDLRRRFPFRHSIAEYFTVKITVQSCSFQRLFCMSLSRRRCQSNSTSMLLRSLQQFFSAFFYRDSFLIRNLIIIFPGHLRELIHRKIWIDIIFKIFCYPL